MPPMSVANDTAAPTFDAKRDTDDHSQKAELISLLQQCLDQLRTAQEPEIGGLHLSSVFFSTQAGLHDYIARQRKRLHDEMKSLQRQTEKEQQKLKTLQQQYQQQSKQSSSSDKHSITSNATSTTTTPAAAAVTYEQQKRAAIEKHRQDVLQQRRRAAAEQKRKEQEEKRKFLELERRKERLKAKAAQDALLLKKKKAQQAAAAAASSPSGSSVFAQTIKKSPSPSTSASARSSPQSATAPANLGVPHVPAPPTSTSHRAAPGPSASAAAASASTAHPSPQPPYASHAPTGADVKYRNMMSSTPPPPPPPAAAMPPPSTADPDTNNAATAIEEEEEDPQVVATLKRNVLLHWALQPPDYQILRPIDALLTSIHTVYPPAFELEPHEYFANWTVLDRTTLLDTGKEQNDVADDALHKAVRKVRFFLHPDKLPRDLNPYQICLCRLLWDVTNDAYEDYRKQQL